MTKYRYEALKADYEGIRTGHPEANLAPYDELTDEKRKIHEDSYDKMHRFMGALGNAISNGTELPNPLDKGNDIT